MKPRIINIVTAHQVGAYQLKLDFDDGSQQVVDFEPFLRHSLHPQIRAYLDAEKFAGFRLDHGELIWGDYALCFPMADLYDNQIDRVQLFAAA